MSEFTNHANAAPRRWLQLARDYFAPVAASWPVSKDNLSPFENEERNRGNGQQHQAVAYRKDRGLEEAGEQSVVMAPNLDGEGDRDDDEQVEI